MGGPSQETLRNTRLVNSSAGPAVLITASWCGFIFGCAAGGPGFSGAAAGVSQLRPCLSASGVTTGIPVDDRDSLSPQIWDCKHQRLPGLRGRPHTDQPGQPRKCHSLARCTRGLA